MEISAFKHWSETHSPITINIQRAFDRIQKGYSKEKINKYRKTKDKDIKNSLPGYCFSGTFKNRSVDGLINHSGLIVLDFDKLPSKEETSVLKDSICDIDYVFAAFISPGGLGLKVLIKIPNDAGNHKLYYNSLFKEFNSEYLDKSGSDISRFCYESFDEDIYINKDSKIWDVIEEDDINEIGDIDISVPLTSENQIISNLQRWFDSKFGANKGERNSNIFKFAMALSDFGISKYTTEQHLLQYQTKDFDSKEIQTIIKSAYKRGDINFGTKSFEDKTLSSDIEKMMREGKDLKYIQRRLKEKNVSFADDKHKIEDVIDGIKKTIEVKEFWYYDKNNKIRLSPHKFKFYLEQNNFIKYFPTDSNTFTFIKKDMSMIEETNEKRIKDYVLSDLLNRDKIGFAPYDFMAGNPGYFHMNFLSMLDSGKIEIKEDTKDECFLYYKNKAIRITKDSISDIDYLDLKGYVWKNQIIDRDFNGLDHHDAEFRKFVWLISGESVDKYNSFKSVIGYMLHSYKTSSNNKAIIFNDETISENPNGGSGKGLLWNALAKMKKISMIDGKTFDFGKSFPYQTVSTDCQVLVFDDVKRNFSFESLFSVITEGITLEYKGQDAIKIPVEKSPKILITTNYTIGGVGGSFDRRKFEVEMSSFFGAHNTPEDVFGHMLFDDWDSDEWQRFDSFMINCLTYYLNNGLVAHEFHNLKTRKFIKNTSFEFYEWTKNHDTIPFNVRNDKKQLWLAIIEEYQDLKKWLTQKRFKNWLEEYCKFYDFEYKDGNSNGQRWFEISNGEAPGNDNDEVPF